MCMYAYLCVCICEHNSFRRQKGAGDSLELEVQVLVSLPIWVLRTKLQPFTNATSALSPSDPSSQQCSLACCSDCLSQSSSEMRIFKDSEGNQFKSKKEFMHLALQRTSRMTSHLKLLMFCLELGVYSSRG